MPTTRFDVVGPDQPVIALSERIHRWFDTILQRIDLFASCGLSLCGSRVQWDLVDRERAFQRAVNEEHGFIYGDGVVDSLSHLISDHYADFSYHIAPPLTPSNAATAVSSVSSPSSQNSGRNAALMRALVGVSRPHPSPPMPPPPSGPTGPVPSPTGRTGLVPLVRRRRHRCHVSPPIVAKLVAAMRAEIGSMCLACKHKSIVDLRSKCSANYQAAQWTLLRLMKDRKLHPEQIQLYLEPCLIAYFYKGQYSDGCGGYLGELGGERPPQRSSTN